ncbi:MAG: hypothetical protein ACREQ4_18720, partial [Candidatus Binataceae bacterium]
MRRYARTGRWKTLRIGWTFAGFLVVTIALGGACADATAPRFTPLNINRLNLIFLPAADTNPATGLLTPRGLQRSLRLDAWLAKIIVSVGDIHAVAPTIMPAASRDSDALNALESVEQLALEYDAPIDASAPGQCGSPCPSRGLDGADIRNADGANEKLVEGIIAAAHRSRATGNHVFSMPAKLLNNLLEYVNLAENFHLKIPQRATDQHDTVYVISIDRANHATLELYRFPVDPPPGYPKIRLTESNACLQPRVTISTRELGLT